MTFELVARLRISLDDVEPAIWRSVDVPVADTLEMLHDVIQAAMGWEDCHLWHVEAGGRRYAVPDPEWPDRAVIAAGDVQLGTLVEQGIRQFTYVYDLGDDWRHTIKVETVGSGEPGVSYPRLVAGERRCPPEDVGGFPGFELFLDAMADPAHEEHRRFRRWHGGLFDPDDIGEDTLKHAVAAIANSRRGGKTARLVSSTRC